MTGTRKVFQSRNAMPAAVTANSASSSSLMHRSRSSDAGVSGTVRESSPPGCGPGACDAMR
ncbi:hypothetical protein [Burkholderia ubonensis]|uniref:hypothetical protein n=1 Tax=Burkholderia ubonensis TaxID=101571 RepID=UPI001E50DD30|nr:hypothetical protein [Burkholderia ubonensis]